MTKVITPRAPKTRWSLVSEVNTELKPATKTIVVIIIPVPTSWNERLITSAWVPPCLNSSRYLDIKWIVSSTAIPKQIVKQQTLTTSNGCLVMTI